MTAAGGKKNTIPEVDTSGMGAHSHHGNWVSADDPNCQSIFTDDLIVINAAKQVVNAHR